MLSPAVLPSVSVLIPAYNEERYIEQCLRSLLAQTYQGQLELIVVDGKSSDRTRAIVGELREQHPHKVRLLDNPQRIIPAALNRGVRAARGEVIVRLDAHAFVDPDYLASAVAKLQSTTAGCIGPRMQMRAASTWTAQAIAAALATPFGPGTASFRYSDKEQLVDTANYAIYRRWLFDQVGLFDLNLPCNEDYDFNYRVRAAGHTILYVPTLRAYYHPRDSFVALWRQYWRYGYWKATMLKKSPEAIRVRQMVAPLFVLALGLGGLGALFSQGIAALTLAMMALYLVVALFFAARQALRSQSLALIPGIAWACFLMHVAWGCAFWIGLLQPRWQARPADVTQVG